MRARSHGHKPGIQMETRNRVLVMYIAMKLLMRKRVEISLVYDVNNGFSNSFDSAFHIYFVLHFFFLFHDSLFHRLNDVLFFARCVHL